MARERYHGRERVTTGMEHVVVRPARLACQTEGQDRRAEVLKISRPFNRLTLSFGDPVEILREELGVCQKLVEETCVRIPKTQIYRTNSVCFGRFVVRSYVIRQDYVEEDGSVSNIREVLQQQGLVTLLDEYDHEPGNFVGNGGSVYWVDPTRGMVGRLLERTGKMRIEDYRRLRRRWSGVIRLFGL
jgi:hypothetical protein